MEHTRKKPNNGIPIYYVYVIGDYAGMSKGVRARMKKHRQDGRNTDGLQLLRIFETKREALDYERHLQENCGYLGKHYSNPALWAKGKKRPEHAQLMRELYKKTLYKTLRRKKKKVWDGEREHINLDVAAEYHGIPRDTAKARCRLKLKNWKYVQENKSKR